MGQEKNFNPEAIRAYGGIGPKAPGIVSSALTD
jgi:hypothetical protein